ncbi:hypothetical protein PG995_000642 [Apiospora arundinis]
MKFLRRTGRSRRPQESQNEEDDPLATGVEPPGSCDPVMPTSFKRGFPQQTKRSQCPQQAYYFEDSSSSESPLEGRRPPPLKPSKPVSAMLFEFFLRISKSISGLISGSKGKSSNSRRPKGKERADDKPGPPLKPNANDVDDHTCHKNIDTTSAKPEGQGNRNCTWYSMPVTPPDGHMCDHCDTVAEAAGPSPGALTVHSAWDLEEVAYIDLQPAVWVKSMQLKQEHHIVLATKKLKYERRRRQLPTAPKWLGPALARNILEPRERRTYDRKVRKLDELRRRQVLDYESRMMEKIDGRCGTGGGGRHSEPRGRPEEKYLGFRRDDVFAFASI